MQRALAGEINLTVSAAIIDEMTDVLVRKFEATPGEVVEAREIIGRAARTVRPTVELEVITDDPADDRILECAVSAGSDYIMTGDSHLLQLKQYAGIRIVNVSDFLELLEAFEGKSNLGGEDHA